MLLCLFLLLDLFQLTRQNWDMFRILLCHSVQMALVRVHTSLTSLETPVLRGMTHTLAGMIL